MVRIISISSSVVAEGVIRFYHNSDIAFIEILILAGISGIILLISIVFASIVVSIVIVHLFISVEGLEVVFVVVFV